MPVGWMRSSFAVAEPNSSLHALHSRRSFLAIATAGIAASGLPRWARADRPGPELDLIELPNGVRVLLMPFEGLETVATEAIYPVGFMHEPDGRPQLAHYVEHLVCYCPTASFDALESMTILNRTGMANAETMATITHYDIAVPSDQFELAVQVEAERLSSLQITEEIRAREAPRCYGEIDFVANQRSIVPTKWAVVAANQFWRYGTKDVRLREGLFETPPDEVRAFVQRHYRPDTLTFVVAGGFERESAIKVIEKHLGAVERGGDIEAQAQINWNDVERKARIRWDLPQRVVIVSYPPPDELDDRCGTTLALSAAGMSLRGHPWMSQAMPALSSPIMPVGEAPAMVMFEPALDTDPMEAGTRAGEEIERVVRDSVAQARQMLGAARLDAPTAAEIERIVEMIAESRRMPIERARMMVTAQTALEAGIALHWLGRDPSSRLAGLSAKNDDWWQKILSSITAERRMVTVLEPSEPK